MKWFVVLLLIANIAVVGWQFNEQVKAETAARMETNVLPAGTPTLSLVSDLNELPELRESAKKEDAEEAAASTVDLATEINDIGEPSNTCINVGPITDDPHLERIRTWFRTRATEVKTQMETVRERRFFWVYLEPTSAAEAAKSLNDLKRRGVTDYMLIQRGGLKNAISLGLFRSQDSVNRRLAEMNRQGYKPVVVPKFETTDHYWVTATMAAGFESAIAESGDVVENADVTETNCGPTPSPLARYNEDNPDGG